MSSSVKYRKENAVSKKSASGSKESLYVGAPVRVRTPLGSVSRRSSRQHSGMVAVREMPIRTEHKKDRNPLPIGVIFTALILTALFLFTIINYAEVDRYNKLNDELQTRIEELKHEQELLNKRIDLKISAEEIARYAEDELGMIPGSDPSFDKRIVRTDSIASRTDVIPYEDEGKGGGLGVMLSGVAEAISRFLK
ncbi:MAG: septum formation initiator family protein [Eubacteriales bacterium]